MKYKVHASWTKLNSNGAGSSKLTNYQGRFTTSRHILAIALSAAAIMIIAAVALAADGVLPEQAGSPLRGHYCVTSAGASLDGVFQTETLAVDVNGTPVAAYLYWSGRYAQSTNGDENLTVSLNGGSPVFVAAEQQNSGTSSYSDRYYYTYRSTDLTQPGSPVLINQSTPFTINVGGLRGDEGHGAGIVVVYENAEACSYGDVYLRYGLDSLHHRHGGESGPNSEVNCLEFEAASIERTLDYQMFVGGVANPQRPNAIWTKTGSGPLPENYWLTDIIEDPSAAHLVNPLDGNEGAGEGEWDNHQSQIMVPAGHTYACIQIESVDDYAPETLGASALWVNLAYKVEGTPPATPTNTPTEVPPTATPTSTPTEVPPTATPTSTPTEVPPTATPTSTPTVPVSPTTDGNVTPIATPNIPAPTFTPTPTPTVPLCTAQTDLHLSQAVSTPVDGNITVTISYWNSGPADLANIRIFETIPSGMMLKSDPANSHWSCESGTCTFEAGTLPAGADQNSAQQIQLHLLVDPNLATGQSTTVNRVVISQESQGLSAQNGCFIEGQADIELPTALDEMPEPNQANLVPAVYVPFIYQ